MASLLTNATSNTTGTAQSHSGPCSIFVRGTFDGARVVVTASDDNSTFVKLDNVSVVNAGHFQSPGVSACNCQGTYYLRATLENAGSSTSVSVETTQ